MCRVRRALCCLLALACMVCPCALAAGSGTEMRVTTAVECEDYNSVGNEWTEILFVNGFSVAVYSNDSLTYSSETCSFAVGEEITVSASITEADKDYPDYGENYVSHTVTRRDVERGFDLFFDVVVEENAGKYKGNRAIWRVSFTFE